MGDVTVVRYSYEGEKFEILVKPDPALDYKLGKKKDISAVLVSDDIYTDSGKGTKPTNEKLLKAFKTEDLTEIAQIILQKGELNLTTDQRRKMIDEKKKRIVEYIAKTYALVYQELGRVPAYNDKSDAERMIYDLVEVRRKLRQSNQWQQADMIRAKLDEAGIVLVDLPESTPWRRRR